MLESVLVTDAELVNSHEAVILTFCTREEVHVSSTDASYATFLLLGTDSNSEMLQSKVQWTFILVVIGILKNEQN